MPTQTNHPKLDSLEHLIFDLDGTLVDSSPSILAGFSAALEAHGITPDVPLESALIGPPLRETLARIANAPNSAQLDSLVNTFKAYYDTEGYKATRPFDGVDAMLHQLHGKGLQLHIATNKRINPTRLILEHLGWLPLFSSVYALDCKTPSYPNKAAMLTGLLVDQNISKANAAYLGDRIEDGQAANANQLVFFGACWGYAEFSHHILPEHWQLVDQPSALIG